MSKVIIEAAISPALYKELGSTATLRAEAIKGFTSSLGFIVPPSNGNSFYLEIPITIDNGEMLIPSFEIDATEDAMPWDSGVIGDVPGYKFTIVTSRGKKIPYFQECKVPVLTEGDPSFRWDELRVYNRNFRRRYTQLDRLITQEQVLDWIQSALGSRDYASETNTGLVALSTDPTDPTWPIAVSVTDPLWTFLQNGGGLISLASTAAMVDGRVTVNTVLIQLTSKIFLGSMDANVSGALHPENIMPGASFDVVSNQGGDNGVVSWMIIN